MPTNYTAKAAWLSDCGLYRYSLNRAWDTGPVCTFIGLNPSTADADHDDPTIRRCVAFAAAWGCTELIMVNLFPFRATDPAALRDVVYPVDVTLKNSDIIEKAIAVSKYSVAAWGNHGVMKGAGKHVLDKYRDRLHYLKLNNSTGQPSHPLYLKADLKPIPFEATDV